MISIDVYEHGRLLIGEHGFEKPHWDAFVKLNTLHNGEYFDVHHNGLRFKQFVGVLQVDGLLVQIHPKADKDDEDGKWRDVLLQMLKACGRIKVQTAGEAYLKKQRLNLLEVYFEYYLHEMEQLLHHGLVKKYRKETSNVKALKGKLDFAGNIRHNLVHKERFYTSHQVYDTNHRLHQVLAVALQIVDTFTRGTRLNDRCKRARLSFPEVDTINVNAALLESLKLDRKTAPYERAFELAKLIILNYSPDINQGKNKMIALLFDMNELWEEYVLKMLRREINSNPLYKDFTIHGQQSRAFWGYNKLKPDIVIEANNQTYIIDTKWKRPGYSASVEDLRQVYAYARFWNAEEVMLLYPGDAVNNRKNPFITDDYISNHPNNETGVAIKHTARMTFVSVLKKEYFLDSKGNKRFELNEKLGEEILGEMKINHLLQEQ